jgi:hypothetical protein
MSHRNGGHRNIPVTTRESGPLGSPLFGLLLEFCDLCSQFGLEDGCECIDSRWGFARTVLFSNSETSNIDQGDFLFGGCLSPRLSKGCESG